ncbi:ribonuclease P protein component [Polymorphobacter sp.]|uniref:ribonuclease P protein component n=1 Tax=Polymorphobacter sp. TaxID=1909290 RepID=UPI003F717544
MAVPPPTIRKRADFLAANRGKRFVTPGFILLVRPREDADPQMRAGYTVTKKVGNAVVRNRLKRRLRAAVQSQLAARGIPGADHVLIGRDAGLARPFADLEADLARALARLS